MSPFIGSSLELPPQPESDLPDAWESYSEEVAEKMLASADYQNLEIGPQLLDAQVRAFNRRSLLQVDGLRGVSLDAGGKPVVVRHSFAAGLSPEEMFAGVARARQGFASFFEKIDALTEEVLNRGDKSSLHVLSRARRARRPGIVFARTAASQEVDPLEDVESRLMVGNFPSY